MYIEKRDQVVNESSTHGIFVPIDSPIELNMDKLENSVLIRLTMGSYECSEYIAKPTEIRINKHYDWCKDGAVGIIAWFLSTDIKVFDCTLFFLSFFRGKPLEDFKRFYKNNL